MTRRPVNPLRTFGQCVIFMFHFVSPLIPTKNVFSQPKSQFSTKPCHHCKMEGDSLFLHQLHQAHWHHVLQQGLMVDGFWFFFRDYKLTTKKNNKK